MAPLCDWVVVGGSDIQRSTVRTRYNAEVYGNVCSDRGDLGEATRVFVVPGTEESSWALIEDSGTAAKVRTDSVVQNGRFVTGGGCIIGMQGGAIFETQSEPICCIDSPVELPGGIAGNVIDTCGLDPLIADCTAAKALVSADIAVLDSLAPTRVLGALSLGATEVYTIDADPGLNVIDIDKLKLDQNSVLTIDAQGDENAVVILRLARGLSSKVKASIVLAGGLKPENAMLYAVSGNCSLGWNNSGSGALFCPNGKVRMQIDTEWVGSVAGGPGVDIGWSSTVTHVPFLGLSQATQAQQ